MLCNVAMLAADGVAMAGAVCLAALAFIAALNHGSPYTNLSVAEGTSREITILSLLVAGTVLTYFAAQSQYHRRLPFLAEIQDVAGASAAAFLFTGCVAFLLQVHGRSMPPPMAAWLIFPFLAVSVRRLARSALQSAGLWKRRALLIAERNLAGHTLSALSSDAGLGYDVVAQIDAGQLAGRSDNGHWASMLASHGCEMLILSYDARSVPGRDAIDSIVRARVPFAVVPQSDGLPVLGFEQTHFLSHDTVMLSFRNNLARPLPRLTKIVFDVVCALAALLVLLPLLLIIAALVRKDGGPVLYGHTRIGVGGRQFRCFKFRSMVNDGDAVLHRLLQSDPAAAVEWAHTQKLRNDPRVTPIGRFLRKTSLDELPQLINILRLEMSVVGPRPIVQDELARYGQDIAYYYETRPGLTGLWQVSGRAGTTYDRRVQLDTWYVKNWTLWNDLTIIAKTIPAVLKQRGAH